MKKLGRERHFATIFLKLERLVSSGDKEFISKINLLNCMLVNTSVIIKGFDNYVQKYTYT